ncbi:hypothetical protein [Humibacter sp.]|uniref:hypothetical protein n=1 Tax=Humibacter sp. TaxID=1940291 RepID=UPI003F7F69C6
MSAHWFASLLLWSFVKAIPTDFHLFWDAVTAHWWTIVVFGAIVTVSVATLFSRRVARALR